MVFISFILSIIITWSIGLAIPLIIRFAIIKKALGKIIAIIITIVNYFITFVIFAQLGSKSKSHAALYLMILCSYGILHNGHKADKVSTNDTFKIEKMD